MSILFPRAAVLAVALLPYLATAAPLSLEEALAIAVKRSESTRAALRQEYGPDTVLGRRRTTIAEAAPTREFSMDAMIEKEPVTVILSQRGWIRAAKGHVPLGADGKGEDFKFKEGDGPAFAFHAQTTDKLLIAIDNGRFYTLGADKLPGARGFGERKGETKRTISMPSPAKRCRSG